MDGILNILKPPGMTSFDVIGYLRGITRIKKIGHTGTLDPAAVGVLPVCIGKATKAIEYLTEKDKLYRAELILGITTDTQDSTGTVITSSEVNVTNEEFEDTLKKFIGEVEQIPPMYSAVKIGGKKLYELAREGITIDRPKRKITVYSINIVMPLTKYEDGSIRSIIDVHCTKGTYIRTLIHDIGERLAVGACMSFLIRTGTGGFNINEALTLEEVYNLHKSGGLNDKLISPDKVFMNLKEIKLDEKAIKAYMNGQLIEYDGVAGDLYRVYDVKNDFAGIGKLLARDGRVFLKTDKQF